MQFRKLNQDYRMTESGKNIVLLKTIESNIKFIVKYMYSLGDIPSCINNKYMSDTYTLLQVWLFHVYAYS